MDKSRLFIASSGRTLTVAEKLRDELQTEFCDATLWSEEGRRSPGSTIIEMLQNAAGRYDFAVIILARDDVVVREAGDALKARDNCVFEAGLFLAALGRERCLLVNSVPQHDLPSDLGGIISIPFEEPVDLGNREECAVAIKSVSAILKDRVQRTGRRTAGAGTSAIRESLPLLSVAEVFQREQPHSDGGDLREGQVVVCDVQPMTDPEVAAQVRRNLEHGVSYLYFLRFSGETVIRACHGLQLILTDTGKAAGEPPGFQQRLEVVRREKSRILDDLQRISSTHGLRVSLFPDEPTFRFRVHNASDPRLASVYMKYEDRGFVLWTHGEGALKVWAMLPRYFPDKTDQRIFVPMKNYKLEGEHRTLFNESLSQALMRYFPGIEDDVRRFCVGHKL